MIRSSQKVYLKGAFVFLILLFQVALLSAQARFSASVNESQVGKNNLVEIRFRIENASTITSLVPPSFDGFSVVSGPNQEHGTTIQDGKRDTYASVSFILRPQKTGKLYIPPATAIADGHEIKSNPLTIMVSDNHLSSPQNAPGNEPASPFFHSNPDAGRRKSSHINGDFILKPGEDMIAKIRKNLIIKLEADKENCFVGEPVVVSFKIYTRLLSRTNITEAPSFNGFSVSEMDVNNNAVKVNLDGVPFSCYTLRKVQLFPTQAGVFHISPLRATNQVNFFRGDESLISDPLVEMMQEIGALGVSSPDLISREMDLSSNELTIHVKPLPNQDRPADFKGAVGKFMITSSLDNTSFTTNDAGTLNVSISGAGNLAMINYPDIAWPKGLEVYDARTDDRINNQQVPTSGSKIFQIPFTASKAGSYQIPAISFSWFDPQLEKYETMHTTPVNFQVEPGKTRPGIMSAKTGDDQRSSVSRIEIIGGIILSVLAVLLVLAGLRRRKEKEAKIRQEIDLEDIQNRKEKKNMVRSKNMLKSAHLLLQGGDITGFYKQLEHGIKDFMAVKLELPDGNLPASVIRKHMKERGLTQETVSLFNLLTQELELELYGGTPDPDKAGFLYKKLEELISLLDNQIR